MGVRSISIFSRKFEDKASNMEIRYICDGMATIWFDMGSIFLYAYIKFILNLEIKYEILDNPIYVSTLVGDLVIIDQLY